MAISNGLVGGADDIMYRLLHLTQDNRFQLLGLSCLFLIYYIFLTK